MDMNAVRISLLGWIGARDSRDCIIVVGACFPAIPLTQFNGVLPLDDEAAPDLADAVAEIEQLGLPCSVQLREEQPPRFAEEARRLGLTTEAHLPALVARGRDLSPGALDGLVITRVDGGGDREVAKATAAPGFGAPEAIFEPIYAAAVFALDGFAGYVGRVGGEPVSTFRRLHRRRHGRDLQRRDAGGASRARLRRSAHGSCGARRLRAGRGARVAPVERNGPLGVSPARLPRRRDVPAADALTREREQHVRVERVLLALARKRRFLP
jgi:hypothetical protein